MKGEVFTSSLFYYTYFGGRMKRCNRCEELKPLSEFYKRNASSDQVQSQCKACVKLYHSETHHSTRRHGLTFEEREAWLESQGGTCLYCDKLSPFMVIHHDHACCPGSWSCGRCVVAILCKKCNTASGGFNDDPEQMRRAADHLEQATAMMVARNVFTRR